MVNKVILIGNLGRDPEVRFTAERNTAIANIALATTRRYRTPDGQTTEETEWHRVVFFGRQAEIARDYLRKGRQIYVEGRLRTRKWTDQEGRDHYTTEVIGENFQMLGRRSDNENSGTSAASNDGFDKPRDFPVRQTPAAAPQPSAVPNDALEDDDVPF